MEHFITKIITAKAGDLASDMSVHNKLVRFSKGVFNGPALKVSIKGKTITVKGSVDYENALAALVIDTMKAEEVTLEGSVLAFEDPSPIIKTSFPGKQDALVVSSKGAKWTVLVSGTWKKVDALRFFTDFSTVHGYVLVKVAVPGEKTQAFTVKAKIPSNKGEYEYEKAIGFCTAKIANDEHARKAMVNMLVPDKAKEAMNAKEIQIENTYDIESLDIPSSSKVVNKRLAAIRKGTLNRRIEIDGKSTETTYSFAA